MDNPLENHLHETILCVYSMPIESSRTKGIYEYMNLSHWFWIK